MKRLFVPPTGRAEPYSFMSAFFVRLVLFLVGALCVTCSLPSNQKDALLALYQSTGGSFWFNNSNWDVATDPCTALWFGVICDPLNENVASLSLPNNNLTGSLPDLDLPELSTL